jgi:TrmH family RNA methyltransferase
MTMAREIITSAQNPSIKFIRALEQKKKRQEMGLFVAEGARALERARLADIMPDQVVSVAGHPDWPGVPNLKVSDAVMARLSSQNNPLDVIGVFRQSAVLSSFQPGPGDVALALEGIRDPGNLGTIIRTADAVAVRHLALVGESCDPFSPEAVRASMGSIFGLRIARLSVQSFEAILDAWPGEIIATAANAPSDYRRSYRWPSLLLMGSEGTGLSAALVAKANVSVRIPMKGGAESLNVAAATALMLYEIKRSELL